MFFNWCIFYCVEYMAIVFAQYLELLLSVKVLTGFVDLDDKSL